MSKTKTQTARLKEQYYKNIRAELKKELGVANDLAVPRLDKIVVNIGVGEAAQDSKRIQSAIDDLTLITGQKPIATKARKAIAQFKLREGMKIGCKVTLRGQRMYEFLDRLVNIAMPRIKDFRGISPKSFDGKGNYAMGIKEQIVFPEINYDQIDKIRGMDIIICTTAQDDTQAMALLKKFNMPFRER